MKKAILIVVGLVCPLLFVSAQEQIKALHVGDTVPDILIKDIKNYSQPEFRLAHFKGRLLILDFWATWCTSCVHLMPILDSLRKAYKGEITIVSVTGNTEQASSRFISRFSKSKYDSLPSIYNDSVLSKMFPHVGLPHEVWIDNHHVVRAITDGRYVQGKYIAKLLNDPEATLPLKKDFLGFNMYKPLLVGGNGGQGNGYSYRSIITPFLDGVEGGVSIQKGGALVTMTGINETALQLYGLAFSFKLMADPKRVKLEIRDSSRYFAPHSGPEAFDNWIKKNCYCYQLTLPKDKAANIKTYIQQDLNRYFNLNGRVEEVPTHCLLIVKRGTEKIPMSHKIGNQAGVAGKNMHLIRGSLSRLYYYLEAIPSLPVILDETHDTQAINIHLSSDTSLTALKRELAPYGLDLISAVRPIKMFILSENNE